MPPTGYLTTTGVESCLQYLASTYPAICQLIILPQTSVEGRTSRAIKIASGGGSRHGVLFLGGVHAREIVNPDLLVTFAFRLCQAYTGNTGLTFGGKSYSADTIKVIVEGLDIFIFPLVNPDGREYVQSPTGDPWWRKNRDPNPSSGCIGVDLNRNFDFLWSSGIGTSANPCDYQIYKGTSSFSEPETRNVQWLLDAYPNIECMIDIHSYSEDLLYPWGDDDNQTTDSSMNFMNPLYNGLRGIPGDTIYKEYILQADQDWFVSTGTMVRNAINAVRGRTYTLMQSIGLYPTTATSDDYAYSRHIVDGKKAKIYAYTLETGREFQPLYSEALNIIAEASSGLIQFCLECLCTVTEIARGTSLMEQLEEMRAFRDREILTTPAGRRYVQLLNENTEDLLEVILRDKKLRERAVDLVLRVNKVVQLHGKPTEKVIDANLVKAVEKLIDDFAQRASPSLKKALSVVEHDLKFFSGKTVMEGLLAAGSVHIDK